VDAPGLKSRLATEDPPGFFFGESTMVRSRRSAYTLFEIVLVMAVVVILSAIAYPSLKSMYGPYKLNGAIDSVRGAWSEARARAIAEGRPYRFSVEPNGTHFRVAPDSGDYWGGSSGPSNDPNGQGLVMERALPSGVHFTVEGGGCGGAPPDSSNDKDDGSRSASGSWTTGVVFQPDGSAKGTSGDDIKLTFQVRGARTTALQLRGMTGNVSVQVQQ